YAADLIAGSGREQAVAAGLTPLRLGTIAAPRDGGTVAALFGTSPSGHPQLTAAVAPPAARTGLRGAFVRRAVTVPAGGKPTSGYTKAVRAGVGPWIADAVAVWRAEPPTPETNPQAPEAQAHLKKLERLHAACKTEPTACAE